VQRIVSWQSEWTIGLPIRVTRIALTFLDAIRTRRVGANAVFRRFANFVDNAGASGLTGCERVELLRGNARFIVAADEDNEKDVFHCGVPQSCRMILLPTNV
jgi:hypothetical protein